ncbi:unnamed protein product [Prorocentrum cordatum]|uniref:Uncharacterized protein n=1 Tax=Prorocentrum cordatum TaxID=2364126 RepID=A0ABN9PFG2_9DINO|nr:unnamed protein product [Polarella glacialis]
MYSILARAAVICFLVHSRWCTEQPEMSKSSRERSAVPAGEARWSTTQLRAAGVLLPKRSKDITSRVHCPHECARAFALRDQVLAALVRGDHLRMFPLLKSLGQLKVTTQILAVTGIGHLVADASLWRRSPHPRAVIFARVLKQKWLLDVRGTDTLDIMRADLRGELKGFKNESFLCAVNVWSDVLEEMDSPPLPRHVRQCLGLILTLCGFNHIRHLGGLTAAELKGVTDSPVLQAALERVLARASLVQPTAQLSHAGAQARPATSSAESFVGSISPQVVQELESHVLAELKGMGITDLDQGARPMEVIHMVEGCEGTGG